MQVIRFIIGIVVVAVALVSHRSQAQDVNRASLDSSYVAGEFRVYTGAGEPASLDDVVWAMQLHEVVFVGEVHDDPTGHMLELELLERVDSLLASEASDGGGDGRSVTLSVEFLQRDVQHVLDEYLAGLITERAFLDDIRPWPRYESDYRGLIEFARQRGIRVIASNAPRRYVSLVTRLGLGRLDDLSPEALLWLPPLPYPEASTEYRDQWVSAIMEVIDLERDPCGRGDSDGSDPQDSTAHHPGPSHHGDMGNQFDAQLLWDATMAYWIGEHLLEEPEDLVVHIAGSFHVERGTGTPEFLEEYRPGTSTMTVVIRPVSNIDEFEPAPGGQWGDFVIQTELFRTLTQIECALSSARP